MKPGWVLVKVKAFGLNHSGKLLRLNEIRADYIQKPVIPGIECVGEVVDASDTDLTAGQKAAALMGGMGRSFNGSYALNGFDPIKDIPNGVYLTGFFSNYPTQQVMDEISVSSPAHPEGLS